MCVITFTSILQKKHSYSVFPQHIKVHALKVKPFAFFKWSVCESMPQINSPADGDKWPAGQKESQEAAPSITTMNYSPSLSLNFQRRMIRQRRGRTHNKNAQFVKFEYPMSLPPSDSDCHTKLFLILSDLKKRKMNQRWSDITKRTYNFRTMSCFFNAIMIWPERDLIWAGRLRYCRGFVWKTDSQCCGGWKGKKSDTEKKTDNRQINQQICQH